jgi:hypothetical protein
MQLVISRWELFWLGTKHPEQLDRLAGEAEAVVTGTLMTTVRLYFKSQPESR